MIELKNWAGNRTFHAARLHAPRSVDELRDIVQRSNQLKAIGTRHSFNGIADTHGDLISLEHFSHIDEPDHAQMTVTIGAGVKCGDLACHLHERGYALHNLASLPHISVAGACATATHGSGDRNGNLTTSVRAMELVAADGSVRCVSRRTDGDAFDGMGIHLGLLGIVTKLTIEIEPAYQVSQTVFTNLPWSQVEQRFDAITASGYSVSLFTNWASDSIDQVWVKRRVTDPAGLDLRELGAVAAAKNVHPLPTCDPINCTEQVGVAGPWHERLPHFRMQFTPSAGEELQSEYFVGREHALAALRAVVGLRRHITPILHTSEIRTVAADPLWLSPQYQRPSVGIHFTWKKDWPAVRQVLPLIEQALAPFDARPHWGKLFATHWPDVHLRYPKWAQFVELRAAFDPTRKLDDGLEPRH
jgi:xylitol oxidase